MIFKIEFKSNEGILSKWQCYLIQENYLNKVELLQTFENISKARIQKVFYDLEIPNFIITFWKRIFI